MKKSTFSFFAVGILFLLSFPAVSTDKTESEHPEFVLVDYEGNEVNLDSSAPYSPRNTCGQCHDYDGITLAYHFQQGRADSRGNLLVNDAKNPGIVDFQDAVYGPITYDLVSLLKDCYIKWPRSEVGDWLGKFYRRAAKQLRLGVGEEQYTRWFDFMGVQRQLKASGIFARLWHRDHKNGFLKDIPRTLSYVTDMESIYPELSPLIDLINTEVLPVLKGNGE